MASSIRAKTYANKAGKAEGRVNKIQVSGDVKEIAAVVKGDAEAVAAFNEAVTNALKAAKGS
jgi:hypothetical protein